jgi:polysaccharide deacetylase 2 family uncharacterized protein YibQ
MAGDAADAAPVVELALVERREGPPPELKTRIENRLTASLNSSFAEEPSLPGIDYAGEAGLDPDSPGFTITELPNEAAEPVTPASVNPLPKAPLPGLHERTAAGELPRIAADGRTPAQAYARPFAPIAGAPRVSIVVSGLGLKESHTRAAINDLPPEVTLSFVPYANNLQTWINRARAAGHEVLLELPMEAYDYPNNDTGPHTLTTTASGEENVRRLELLLGKATGYFGVINYQGAKFATDAKAAGPVLAALKSRGLAVLHDGAANRSVLPETAKSINMTFTVADRVVDFETTADAIDRELLQLEALALENGSAVGVGYAFPVTIEQLRIWTEGLKAKGYQLAPASSAALGKTPAASARRNGL